MEQPPFKKDEDLENSRDIMNSFEEFMIRNGPLSEKLTKILKVLETNIPEIEASSIVSPTGLPIASALPKDVDETKIAAMTAVMLNLGERAASELRKGEVEQVMLRLEDGFLVTISAGENAVLTVSASKDAKLGMIFLEMKRAAEKIENQLTIK
jgi:predicted regulator of Ras-like GTPase activity (Roadblock/LC7/MglB family)